MNSETLVKEAIIKDIKNIVSDKQVVTDHETLYDAASDRYRKYMKAKGVLDNPRRLQSFIQTMSKKSKIY